MRNESPPISPSERLLCGPGPTNVDPAALDAHCLDHIARFKRPKDYRFVEALPKNNYGKVLKTALRELLAAERR